MKRTLCLGALIVLTAMTPACSLKIFEDVGTDPHPPTVRITSLEVYVAPVETTTTTTDKNAAAHRGRSIAWDSGGFTLDIGQVFQIGLVYTDAGGDIVKFRLRDRDGETNLDLTPVDQTYFSGTMGTALGPTDGAELTGVSGPHRLELWAEDSHESRSEKVEFVITIPPPR